MEYRQLGRSGLRVSALTLGTMTFGGRGGFSAVGATDVDGGPPSARHVPGRRGEPDRHRRRLLGRAGRGDHRRRSSRAPGLAAAVDQGADVHGRRAERRRAVPPAHHRGLRGQPAPAGHRPHRHLPRARVGRADPARGDPVRARLAGRGGEGALPGGVQLRRLAADEGARAWPTASASSDSSAQQIYYSLEARDAEYELVPLLGRPGPRHPGLVAAGRRPGVGQVPPRRLAVRSRPGSCPASGTSRRSATRRSSTTPSRCWSTWPGAHGASPAQVALAWLLGRPGRDLAGHRGPDRRAATRQPRARPSSR